MRRTTMFMACLAFLAFYFLLQDMRDTERNQTFRSRFVYDIDSAGVSEIAIRRNGEEHVAAVRAGEENWYLTQPFEIEASPFAFAPILNFISAGMYETILSKDGVEDFSLARFGLENPPLNVVFKAEGRQYSFDISPVMQNTLYIRRNDQPDRVYLVPPHFYNFFNKNLNELRPRTVFTFKDLNVTEVALSGETHLKLVKPGQDIWLIDEPFDWPGSPGIIASYLTALKALRIKDFVKDGATDEELALYGLDKPTAAIEVTISNGKPIRISIGKKEQELYYFRDERLASVFSAPAAQIEGLIKPDIKLFRNRDLGIFHSELVSKIVLDNLISKERIQLERDAVSSPWKCTWPEDEAVGTERVNAFLKTLQSTRIINFTMEGADKLPAFELDSPDIVLSLYKKGSGGTEDKMYALHLKNKGKDMVFGNIEDTISILRLPVEYFNFLNSGLAAFKSLYLVPPDADNPISWLAISGVNRVRFECKLTPERRWEIIEPSNKVAVTAEIQKTTDILSHLKAESVHTLKLENHAELGFDEPRAIVSFIARGRRFDLHIGNVLAEGTGSYVKMADRDIVYTMSKEHINELIKDTGLFIQLPPR